LFARTVEQLVCEYRLFSRLSLEEMGSMSPPAHDESFFYIRLPVAQKPIKPPPSSVAPPPAQLPVVETASHLAQETVLVEPAAAVDFSQECKKYIAGLHATPAYFNSTKPKGTDDDFKTAACAGSLVKVAQKFVSSSGKQTTKRFTVAKLDDHDDHAAPIDDSEDSFQFDPSLMQRRNSRSLPASPLHSPKTMRKFQPQPNPYFTITGSDAPQPKASWFLTNLFGVRRELTTSTMSVSSQIDEADEPIEAKTKQQSPPPVTELSRASPAKDAVEPKPQPTMLREMNFWAPTSY
jgi:hypothetical protein